VSSTEALSGEKEALFERYHRGEISFEHLSRRVYDIDHPSPKWPRTMVMFVVAAFLPLLFVGAGNQRAES